MYNIITINTYNIVSLDDMGVGRVAKARGICIATFTSGAPTANRQRTDSATSARRHCADTPTPRRHGTDIVTATRRQYADGAPATYY